LSPLSVRARPVSEGQLNATFPNTNALTEMRGSLFAMELIPACIRIYGSSEGF